MIIIIFIPTNNSYSQVHTHAHKGSVATMYGYAQFMAALYGSYTASIVSAVTHSAALDVPLTPANEPCYCPLHWLYCREVAYCAITYCYLPLLAVTHSYLLLLTITCCYSPHYLLLLATLPAVTHLYLLLLAITCCYSPHYLLLLAILPAVTRHYLLLLATLPAVTRHITCCYSPLPAVTRHTTCCYSPHYLLSLATTHHYSPLLTITRHYSPLLAATRHYSLHHCAPYESAPLTRALSPLQTQP